MSSELWELAREYYRRTEEFDITVCSGRVEFHKSAGPCAMPTSLKERAAVARNAQAVKEDIMRRCRDPDGLRSAMRQYVASAQFPQDMLAIHQAASARRDLA